MDGVRAGGEGEPDGLGPVDGVEVVAGGQRDAGLLQQGGAVADGAAELRQHARGETGPEVEGAVGGGGVGPAEPGQGGQHDAARRREAAGLLGTERVGLLAERVDGRLLGRGGRAEGDRAGEAVDRGGEVVRHEHPAQPPAGHAPVLGERADHERGAGGAPCAGAGPLPVRVHDAVVDLVRDEPHTAFLAPAGELGELVGADHRARGIGRGGEHEPRDRALRERRLQVGDRGLVAGAGVDVHVHHLHPERREDVAVRRIAGARQEHAVSRGERREEAEHERPRGARGDRDLLGAHVEPVPAAVVAGDGGPQLRQAQRRGVGEGTAGGVDGGGRGVDGGRGAPARLPRAQADDVVAGGTQLGDPAEDAHHRERRHL